MTMSAESPGWGIRSVLFSIGEWPVPSYSFFMILAVVVGLLLFWRETRIQNALNENSFYLFLAAMFGGVIGSKIPILIVYWKEIVAQFPHWGFLLSGRSIVGGLVGGAIGVYFVKKRLKIVWRTGNLFVPALAAGIAVGRLGCFLRGCCYGTPTGLPWGVDFGDGILRHPTQLYESLFMVLILCLAFVSIRRWPSPAGMIFKVFMVVFFTFRFFIEFIRAGDALWFRLSIFQWISLAIILFYGNDLVWLLLNKDKESHE